ncbi:hypothetical protein NKR19_g9441 [Coniochaeta hoffmannii]|uniref:Transmembrane protein n=1 Tax=Coniochaeta hoffmannii TaxID=91930 RepID=A0AA38R3F5_9PEZI|nr:hypothetical protein NKR19_g9441 [Coniochaeta hoffmannii]
MAQVASTSPLQAHQAASTTTDGAPVAPVDGPNMSAFIGWSALAVILAAFTGVAIWAIIRAHKHKKEKYGKKAVEMQVRDAAVARITAAAEGRNAGADKV